MGSLNCFWKVNLWWWLNLNTPWGSREITDWSRRLIFLLYQLQSSGVARADHLPASHRVSSVQNLHHLLHLYMSTTVVWPLSRIFAEVFLLSSCLTATWPILVVRYIHCLSSRHVWTCRLTSNNLKPLNLLLASACLFTKKISTALSLVIYFRFVSWRWYVFRVFWSKPVTFQ